MSALVTVARDSSLKRCTALQDRRERPSGENVNKYSVVAAASVAGVVILTACNDATAPSERRTFQAAQPRYDHGTIPFQIAYTQCIYYGTEALRCDILGPYPVSGPDDDPSGFWGPKLYNPTWSPDGLNIAVDDSADVFVVRNGSLLNLTNHRALDHSPVWSPDGSRIAFLSDRDGETSLYVMRATDGGDVTRLTSVSGVGKPTWSPDSRRLAFGCHPANGYSDICAIDANGGALIHLTNDMMGDASPDWSPDGTRIAFLTSRFGALDIATMSPDGTNITRMTGVEWNVTGLDWSPDGT